MNKAYAIITGTVKEVKTSGENKYAIIQVENPTDSITPTQITASIHKTVDETKVVPNANVKIVIYDYSKKNDDNSYTNRNGCKAIIGVIE